ncbi:putative fluoride ion transporter CrcB 1 [Caldovatus sediminis]|uniref:Fluoride-specific ion channel FluC n=1 Tax=Caldovatus sediminis TaxID=2041189 RepID=A0A8J2ZAD7_9PROT|nr:CrcB family protein [Caldovatus sediminis]GGG28315.1 putative fluoride ion transporter CrcB 1 [Caldovatus sediminis]
MAGRLRLYAAVAAGGALGSVARHLCSLGALALLGPAFPWGTLLVNTAGSFLIAFYAALTEPGGRLFAAPATRQFVMAGFCGGFTTFSIFSLESVRLASSAAPWLAGAYVLASLVLWLAAAWLGHLLAQRLNRLRGMRP